MSVLIVFILVIMLILVLRYRKSEDEENNPTNEHESINKPKSPVVSQGVSQKTTNSSSSDSVIGASVGQQINTLPNIGVPQPVKEGFGSLIEPTSIVAKPYSIKSGPLLTDKFEIEYSQKLRVKYNLVSSENFEFPLLRTPTKETFIKLPVHGRSGRRGACEDKLCSIISKYKLEGFMDNLTMFAKECPYEPDLAYINVDKGIFIDIEVDEPYSGWEKTPIHYKIGNHTIDDKRNQCFTERGWFVLRFSEKQVFEQTMSCLKYLYQQICRIDTSMAIPSSLASVPDLKVDSMWTEAEAFQMIQNKVREKMLGISEFIMPRGNSVTSNLIDYEEAGKIEDAIKTLRDDKVWRNYSEKGWWQKYIDERPNGKYVFEAKKKLDDILWVECEQAKNYDLYLKNSELQKHSKEARKLKEEEAKIKAENVRREMERIVALKEEAMRKEEEERLERQKREEEERKKREAENYARQHVSSQTQTRTPSSRGYA